VLVHGYLLLYVPSLLRTLSFTYPLFYVPSLLRTLSLDLYQP
jgi:hypothetical protein